MDTNRAAERGVRAGAALLAFAGASYAAYATAAWLRYGRAASPRGDDADDLLDLFMPQYDVAERHHVSVAAPAGVTYRALMDLSLEQSAVVRAIFSAREILLRGRAPHEVTGRTLVAVTRELGWKVLAETPGHEIVMGAMTRPWEANVVFRGIPPGQFAAFDEPDYVKIVWTLRADAIDERSSIARSETRAVATDAPARRKFRWYWARFSAGIALIREVSMRLVRKEAERRAQHATATTTTAGQPK